MPLTKASLLQYSFAHLDSKRENSALIEPLILAMAVLTCYDYARFLLDNNSEMAKKLTTATAAQSWSSSQILAPTDMLYHRQIETTRMDIAGVQLYQIEDKKKLDLLAVGLGNSYYALEGKTFFIKHLAGTASGTTNLTIKYYKIPAITDIDDESTPLFLELLFQRLIPISGKAPAPTQNGSN
jgi:hypothetical protein